MRTTSGRLGSGSRDGNGDRFESIILLADLPLPVARNAAFLYTFLVFRDAHVGQRKQHARIALVLIFGGRGKVGGKALLAYCMAAIEQPRNMNVLCNHRQVHVHNTHTWHTHTPTHTNASMLEQQACFEHNRFKSLCAAQHQKPLPYKATPPCDTARQAADAQKNLK